MLFLYWIILLFFFDINQNMSIGSKKELKRYTKEEVDDLYREDKFYNYGDNPAYKKFMEIT